MRLNLDHELDHGRIAWSRAVSQACLTATLMAIAALRRLRFTGPEIAELLDRPQSTVSGILTRIEIGRLRDRRAASSPEVLE